TRSIERIESSKVFDGNGLITPEYVSHAMRFELEHARCESAVKYFLVGLVVFERNALQRNAVPTRCRDQFHRVIQDGQCGKPEKIHFEQTHFLDSYHVKGGHNFVVLSLV